MEENNSGSRLQTSQSQSFDGTGKLIQDIDESQLVRVPVVIAGDSVVSGHVAASTATVSESGGKRKRGRPPKGQAKPPPAKKMKMKEKEKEEEEDVCFICFDGGSLVLCDRRGCPKAYHPACIKRDEAFFQSKVKWNCGWHICSKCQKASHYMCYTCTYSLCKGCTKDADYVSVRGDKGFCMTCLKTVMLIENNGPVNKEMPQVDFDDKTSWEYLFKIYWIYLKQKLSLTLTELTQAKSPWKGAGATMGYKGQSPGIHYGYNNGKIPISNTSSKSLETKSFDETKNIEQLKTPNGDSLTSEKRAGDKDTFFIGSTEGPAKERPPQSNRDDYAAIDVHNIKLIYLRRDLIANLVDDNEKFHAKVVGSIVRIRIPSSDEKQDVHRLVKVVGTNKVAVPYTIGNKTSDVTLKVLNLDKQEDVSIDAISNQDFSEEECIHLRRSVRRGLVERLTVGEVQAKAMALQAAKFKDRLQLLKSPEERRRRLCEAPEVHSDPKMDPNYQSEEDAGECNGNKQDKEEASVEALDSVDEGKDAHKSNSSEGRVNEIGPAGLVICTPNNQAVEVSASLPVITSETSTTPLSTESTPPANESEAEKLWHYRDLNGQIQGPFSMLQLQKWSATGCFPPDMRIWASNRQDDSVLLTDALDGQLLYNISVQFQEAGGTSDSKLSNSNINAVRKDSNQTEELQSNSAKDPSIGNSEVANESNRWDPLKGNDNSNYGQPQIRTSVQPSSPSGEAHVAVSEKGQEVERWDSDLNNENWNSHGTNTAENMAETTTSVQVHENQSNGQIFPGQSSGQNWRPLPLNFFPNNLDSGERNGEVDIPDLHSPAPNTSSGGWESQATENKQSVSSGLPVRDSVTVDLPILTLKMSNEDNQKEREAENIQNKQSLPMNFPVHDSGPSWSNATGLEVGGYFPNTIKPSVEDWDSGSVLLKPHEALGDGHVSSLSSKIDQLFHSPRSHPAPSWQMGFTERIEFSTLAEESVSDLLAEVDAMESQGGLPSPTSVMKCGEDLIHGPKHDYFSSMEEEFSPTLDPVKTGAVSSTSDIQLPSQSTIRGEPIGSSKADIFDPIKGSSGQSSTRTHVPSSQGKGFDTFDTDVSRKARSKSKSTRWDTVQQPPSIRARAEEETRSTGGPRDLNSSYVQFSASFTTGQDMVDSVNANRSRTESMDTDWLKMHQSSERAKSDGRTGNRDGSSLRVPSPLNVSRRSGPEVMDDGWDTTPVNLNSGLLGKSPQGIANTGWGSAQGLSSRGSGSMDHGASPGSRGRDSQRKHGGDRLTSPRDRVSHSRDGRGSKSSWSRHSSAGAGGGGGGGGGGYSSSRHPPRGQRVCKFYESGHCKKGAKCDYFHP
ncbi:hypothetical protein LguiB_033061 [Lonicera macranthoides]